MKRLSPNLMLAGAIMSSAVSVLALFASSLPNISVPLALACVFIASFMTWVPVREDHGLVFASIDYLLVVLIAFLICRNGFLYLLYILFFGHYPMFKHFIELRERDKPLCCLYKLLYYNCFCVIGIAVAQYGFGLDLVTFIPKFPIWAIIAVLQLVFILYELLYSFLAGLFDSHVRRHILPRR